MFSWRIAPWSVACALFAAAASASTDHGDIPLSMASPPALRQAIVELWAGSPDVQAAGAELRAAQASASAAAQPLYNPSLQLEGENADVNRRTVGASLSLDLSGKRRARMAEADASVRSREAAYALARRDVAAAWLKAWSAATLARQQTELGRRRLALMRQFDELAAQRLRVGDISSPERDLGALALSEAQMQQATLEGEEASALSALAAMGAQTSKGLPDLPRSLPPESGTWRALARDERPELIQARAEGDRADAAVITAQRARRPDPTISLTGGRVQSGNRTDRVVGVSLSIPLPVFNSGRYEVVAAQAQADAVNAARLATALRADAGVTRAMATYGALRNALDAFRQSRANALDERTATLGRLWEAGEISTADYLVQLKQSLDTSLAGVALENQTWQAWFDYLVAAGRLNDWIDGTTKDSNP
ncbi:cobalt-zinc-cadmium efflux system outer membrane protein [Luteibacter sp. Sphag1AF]|uniref:TolC family protein n=1 Tax=Luteibacter sp. Sphag1AF TaxID=2587031 RepID=UPI0017DC34A9|nr:TolC family protein [Luteibacter sp. Sphag1AF]MBB3228252.1 cobalt-zinc-cadmium efflux system outer membrane protein [Luteibacter sp. Sphag1AF]